jgi:hypothetical protein
MRRLRDALSPFPWQCSGGASPYPLVRFIADPVSVDPLGSCAMGPSVFPEIFLGVLATRPIPAEFAKGRVTWLPICIPPCARANVLGRAKAITSAIVVTFMVVSFQDYIGDNRTGTTKILFSAIAVHISQSGTAPVQVINRLGFGTFARHRHLRGGRHKIRYTFAMMNIDFTKNRFYFSCLSRAGNEWRCRNKTRGIGTTAHCR